jgi:hypothetical protein
MKTPYNTHRIPYHVEHNSTTVKYINTILKLVKNMKPMMNNYEGNYTTTHLKTNITM